MTDTNDKTRLISLPEAADLYGLSHSYLKQLAQKDRLKAQKIGGVWLTTPTDMETYISGRQKRGAFREDLRID